MTQRTQFKSTIIGLARAGTLSELLDARTPPSEETLTTFLHKHGFSDLFDATRTNSILDGLRAYLHIMREITEKHAQLPWLGSAVSAIEAGAGDGYYQHYQHGSIYWSPTFRAHEVHGAIRDKWASLGWERSYLGYPQTDELSTHVSGQEVRYSNFQGGSINWTAGRGAYIDPTISVRTEPHQLGGWIHISGQGFTPGGVVHLFADHLINFNGSFSLGSTTAHSDGRFIDYVYDARMRTGQSEPVTVRAVDATTGAFATGTTTAFNDRR